MHSLSTIISAGGLFCAADVLGVHPEARRHQRGPALYAGQQPVLWRALILDGLVFDRVRRQATNKICCWLLVHWHMQELLTMSAADTMLRPWNWFPWRRLW